MSKWTAGAMDSIDPGVIVDRGLHSSTDDPAFDPFGLAYQGLHQIPCLFVTAWSGPGRHNCRGRAS